GATRSPVQQRERVMTTQFAQALPMPQGSGNLYDILTSTFGPGLGGYTSFSVAYYGAGDLADPNGDGTAPPYSYWDTNNPVLTTWYRYGNPVASDIWTKHVLATDMAGLQSIELQAGNDIWQSALIRATDAAGNQVIYEVPTVDSSLISP